MLSLIGKRWIAPWSICALLFFFVLFCQQPIGSRGVIGAIVSAEQNYSTFSHSSPREHADLMSRKTCGACHRRTDLSVAPRFPVHRDCTNCHLVQFTASNKNSSVNPICTICHTREGLNSSNPPTKSFSRLVSFTADFDHAQHLQGKEAARPYEGCNACHRPLRRGIAQTIPAQLNAHEVCYQCHSPGKSASDTSGCGSCHGLGPYSPTSTNARAYNLGFSHADHSSRGRVNCESCHNLKPTGLLQRKQVTSILVVEHFANPRTQSCKTCHSGQRVFGDADTHDCKRCHKKEGFRMS